VPPSDDAYLTPRELGRKPRAGATEQDLRRLDGRSAFDDLQEAINIGRTFPKMGRYVVRYDVPEGCGVTWEPTGDNPHHFDLCGDKEAHKRCLTDEWHEIDRSNTDERRARKQGTAMTYDLMDTGAAKYLGRFGTEAEALALVRALLDTNGDDHAQDLALAATEDRRDEHALTGAALFERAALYAEPHGADEERCPSATGSRITGPVRTAAGAVGRTVKRFGERTSTPSKDRAWGQRAAHKSGRYANQTRHPIPDRHKPPRSKKD
jgi:hypothetical protein